jgi:hypothetical protein
VREPTENQDVSDRFSVGCLEQHERFVAGVQVDVHEQFGFVFLQQVWQLFVSFFGEGSDGFVCHWAVFRWVTHNNQAYYGKLLLPLVDCHGERFPHWIQRLESDECDEVVHPSQLGRHGHESLEPDA